MITVYILYGFRWPRMERPIAPGVRPYIIINNIDDASAEYLQYPHANAAMLETFQKRIDKDMLVHLPNLQLIEQYDPEDVSADAVTQPYAFVAASTSTMRARALGGAGLSFSPQEIMERETGLTADGEEMLKKLRDELAPDAEIGWFVVYNGEPERGMGDGEDEREEDEDEDMGRSSEGKDVADGAVGSKSPKTTKTRGLRDRLFGT
ncbi:hypothetical protein AJ79_05747 [Helicocarpus griseus UAMH5409]|uniref:Uncharacterized protein n=1 Tax=Helicocarpus griseus UAMH5409 TaxID=1447875 RepID=A0A2B7XKS5_9EURO|nr:hypothetical protein AJ79_05747 [Helicocarpus griseus UAMH5409]